MQAIELVKDRKTKEPATTEDRHDDGGSTRSRPSDGRGGMLGNVIRMSPR